MTNEYDAGKLPVRLIIIEWMPTAVPLKVLGITSNEALTAINPHAELCKTYNENNILKIKTECVNKEEKPKIKEINCKLSL